MAFHRVLFEGIGRHHNIYDCIDLNNVEYTRRMFGNANVGNRNLTNLQVAGMSHFASGDEPDVFVVQRWYARTTVPKSVASAAFFHNAHATLIIGERPEWQLPLADLLARRPRYQDTQDVPRVFDPFPTTIPHRQSFSVLLDRYQLDAYERMLQGIESHPDRHALWPPRVWIHLEGMTIRDSKLIEALQQRDLEARTIEERLKAWILNNAPADDAGKAQAQAYADAIEEGRHRG